MNGYQEIGISVQGMFPFSNAVRKLVIPPSFLVDSHAVAFVVVEGMMKCEEGSVRDML